MQTTGESPSVEEYWNTVKKHLKYYMSWMDDTELENYMYSGESSEFIAECYKHEKEKFAAGEINIAQFMEAGTSGTAYALFLLY